MAENIIMKKYLLISAIFGCVAANAQQENNSRIPVIKAVHKTADYLIGTELHKGTWTISPQIKRDTLLVKCYGSKEVFIFKTDSDSLKYTMKPGDTRSFIVNLNDTASAFTVAYAISVTQSLHYSKSGNEDSIRFWYDHQPEPYMNELEKKYPTQQLVKAANNDLAAIAALLEWTHNQWKHNGNNSPSKSDALTILNEAKAGGQFPCFAFSIVLAAKLNAAGYPSRVLYLKSRTVETDKYAPGHVVTEAYIASLHKWIFLDGQFNAMPMLKGVPLNAVEFQKAISENSDKITFYNKVNYNNYPYTNRTYFNFVYPTLYYFDFRFDSRTDTGKVTFEKIKGKTNLMLVPIGAPNPVKFGSITNKINYCLYTNNVKLFYTAPTEN